MALSKRAQGKRNRSQFKNSGGGAEMGVDQLRSFVARTSKRLVGQHALNQNLITFLLRDIGPRRKKQFVKEVQKLLMVDGEMGCEVKEGPRALVVEESTGILIDPRLIEEVAEEDKPPKKMGTGLAIERQIRRAEDPDEAERAVEALMLKWLERCNPEEEVTAPALLELAEAFTLEQAEVDIILFLLAYRLTPHFEMFCDRHRVPDWPYLMATAADVSASRIRELLAEDAPLRANGLVARYDEDFPPYYSLSPTVGDFLTGLSERPLADLFVTVDTFDTYPVESFLVEDHAKTLVQSLIGGNESCHILLHGQAGTGKTEFARSLIRESGKRICFVEPGEEGKATERRTALAGGARMARPAEAVLIVDEADSLLNTDHPFRRAIVDKGWVNMFLDRAPAIVIWITNQMGAVPTSIRRRFNYAIEFKPLARQQRVAMWDRVLAGTPFEELVNSSMRQRLAGSFHVDAAGISGAVQSALRLLSIDEADPAIAEALLTDLLTSHQLLVTGMPPHEVISTANNYRPEALHIDGDRGALEESLITAASAREQGHEDTRVNLLFWGPPGTGKTEYAKHLAAGMGMNLVVKTASELLDMYVGNTEKLIRAAFEEAAGEDAILFIDEADSFFTERAGASRSWEVTRTNELLQQMERHNGILICCTNFLHGLDKAALRRFDWKVEFKALDDTRLLLTYQEYFGEGRPVLTNEQQRRLTGAVGVTFGDFRAVVGRFRFAGDETLTHDTLIDAILAEVAYRKGDGAGRKLGFA